MSEELGNKSLIDGYVQIPIFTYSEDTMLDDIRNEGCPYVHNTYVLNWVKEKSTFASVEDEFLQVLKRPVSQAFNLPLIIKQLMGFRLLYLFTDILIAEDFEGM